MANKTNKTKKKGYHLFSSCYLQVVTRCIYKLLQCTSSSCIITFGNDVVHRKRAAKNRSKFILYTTTASTASASLVKTSLLKFRSFCCR